MIKTLYAIGKFIRKVVQPVVWSLRLIYELSNYLFIFIATTLWIAAIIYLSINILELIR